MSTMKSRSPRAWDATLEHFGRLDGVVNNAGAMSFNPPHRVDAGRLGADAWCRSSCRCILFERGLAQMNGGRRDREHRQHPCG